MANIYFFSGPCGCGKSTLADAFAKDIVNNKGKRQVYVIHGDTFHQGFVEADNKDPFFVNGEAANALEWKEILSFNWECILETAAKALKRGIDVIIDYVVEERLPLLMKLAEENRADLYYVVLTVSEEKIVSRITERGDVDMIERALFLKNKLDNMPENQGHLFDNSDLSVEQEIERLNIEDFIIK